MILAFIAGSLYRGKEQESVKTCIPTPIHVNSIPDPRVDEIIEVVNQLPHKVLESITASSNNQKGKLGELIGYLNLNSKYDKLIALRDITDFIGIRFTKNGEEGTIDFIDVKNGPSARLSKEQMRLKQLIKDGKIRFFSFKVDTSTDSDTLD